MKPFLFLLITLFFTSCGMVGFENKSAVAAREHLSPINDGEYDNITSTEGEVKITRTVRYKAIIKADTAQAAKQEGIDATSKVEVKLAVSKYLSTIFTGGAGSAMLALDSMLSKPEASLTPEEALALAITANKKNGNVEPKATDVVSAVENYLPKATSDKAKAAAMELLNTLKKKE